MNAPHRGTLYERAKQLAGEYAVTAGLRAGGSDYPILALDILVERIHQGMQEAYLLGALGPDRVPVSGSQAAILPADGPDARRLS